MKKYSINIDQAYTLSDWKGQPAHKFFARVHLDDTCGAYRAEVELRRLMTVYPFPEYHLTLHSSITVTYSETLRSAAPRAYLEGKMWNYPSTEDTPETGE